MRLRYVYIASIVMVAILTPAIAISKPVTIPTLNGSWELRTACMNDHGKPGACIEMKRGSLEFNFDRLGKWSSAADDTNKTKKGGTYQVQNDRLILKNADGSLYQNWRPDFSADGQSFQVIDRQLIETFVRVTQAEPTLE
ncbi:MAG TPA: hypothetical protein VK814_01155 [Acidobacteriaceae bacterium]|jgi:hypothetical protein|nr:hypothetical protein [Acidobacteriaceae bacterium]